MSKIDLYGTDSVIQDEDKIIGTDGTSGSDSGKTKNFTVSSLTTYISAETLSHPVIITGLLEAADDSAAATAADAASASRSARFLPGADFFG